MSGSTYTFVAPMWQHDGAGGWHFLTLPGDLADEIRHRVSGRSQPFGTVPVVVTIGTTTWATSLFADRKSGSYQLPVKAHARKSAGLRVGDRIACQLELADGG